VQESAVWQAVSAQGGRRSAGSSVCSKCPKKNKGGAVQVAVWQKIHVLRMGNGNLWSQVVVGV